MPETREFIKFEAVGALTVGLKDRFQAPHAGEITNVSGAVGVAPTGAALIFEIQKNGVTTFTTATKPTVAISATETADGTNYKPDVVTFAKGDTLALNITQVGSTVAGSDLDATVEYVVL